MTGGSRSLYQCSFTHLLCGGEGDKSTRRLDGGGVRVSVGTLSTAKGETNVGGD